LTFTDQITGNVFRIKNEIEIPIGKARALKKILQSPFVALPVYIRNKQMTRVEIRGVEPTA
jgi:hypothetical protein